MRADTFLLQSADDTPLHVRRWLPDGDPTAVVQVAHGMAEHSGRYERFAQALTAAGYAVYAEDHRGHGRTSGGADTGYLADSDGWNVVVEDLAAVTARASSEHPHLPVVLFGHSMGSFLARSYAMVHGTDLAGLVLCGTAGDPGTLGAVGKGVATLEARTLGRRHTSKVMNTLTFGQYNAAFKPNRTDFDWLSRDPAEVDAYIADPRCGEVFTAGFYVDLLGALAQINRDDQVARIPAGLPILLISGDHDPVGGKGGAGVKAVAAQLEKSGVRDVTLTLYPGARHELLNETNRDEVTADVLAWIAAHLPRD
ncbi:alpha/beta hydrolase [Allobranchiibius huperziae]|uniref:Alpha-beta hydrolase superfamily lysophospholipase n=1 Tax=Allobranchiibius huperziae TaxID=1874116 RepID=A0A853D803_9MICO|nr:alpha/beta hydrolase [Allobranchiibius huperziae]NYJ73292.1 alpha-beta hydrolase superfamily lysophospholipase [Allobranchiibius huperziae]